MSQKVKYSKMSPQMKRSVRRGYRFGFTEAVRLFLLGSGIHLEKTKQLKQVMPFARVVCEDHIKSNQRAAKERNKPQNGYAYPNQKFASKFAALLRSFEVEAKLAPYSDAY